MGGAGPKVGPFISLVEIKGWAVLGVETKAQAAFTHDLFVSFSLQALFAMMEFTNRRAVDPNDFIAKLGLDPQVQQDAAEFSKLFISLLESSLSNQDCNEVRSIVQNQFRGQYAYVTQCCKCQRESKRPSFFYELEKIYRHLIIFHIQLCKERKTIRICSRNMF